jgi:hypothetical protein
MPAKRSINMRVHAKHRANQRYNIDFNRNKRKNIVELIQKNKNILKREKLTLRVTFFQMMFEEKMVNVLYDKRRKDIITFLPDKKEIKIYE